MLASLAMFSFPKRLKTARPTTRALRREKKNPSLRGKSAKRLSFCRLHFQSPAFKLLSYCMMPFLVRSYWRREENVVKNDEKGKIAQQDSGHLSLAVFLNDVHDKIVGWSKIKEKGFKMQHAKLKDNIPHPLRSAVCIIADFLLSRFSESGETTSWKWYFDVPNGQQRAAHSPHRGNLYFSSKIPWIPVQATSSWRSHDFRYVSKFGKSWVRLEYTSGCFSR